MYAKLVQGLLVQMEPLPKFISHTPGALSSQRTNEPEKSLKDQYSWCPVSLILEKGASLSNTEVKGSNGTGLLYFFVSEKVKGGGCYIK